MTSATDEVLEGLVDHSMLRRRAAPDGTTRLSMLEPVREYGAERLAARADAAAIGETATAATTSSSPRRVAPELLAADQLAWQRRLDAEADNFAEALEREHRLGDGERVVRLATALREWWRRGRASQGRMWTERGLAAATDLPDALRAGALTTVSQLSAQQGDIADALGCARQALELYERAGDERGKTIALVAIAVCHVLLGDSEAAGAAAARRRADGPRPRGVAARLRAHRTGGDRAGSGVGQADRRAGGPAAGGGRRCPRAGVAVRGSRLQGARARCLRRRARAHRALDGAGAAARRRGALHVRRRALGAVGARDRRPRRLGGRPRRRAGAVLPLRDQAADPGGAHRPGDDRRAPWGCRARAPSCSVPR